LKPRSAPFACAKGKAALAQAQVELDKTPVRAGLAGTVQHSTPRPGGVVNTMIRPAGILGPTGAGKGTLIAGFDQIRGAGDEAGHDCRSHVHREAFTIIPLVVTQVPDVIAAQKSHLSLDW
jgi:hypothetical protein